MTINQANTIVEIAGDVNADISLFFAAQNELDNCNLFLDTIINCMYYQSSDASSVVDAAKKIRKHMNEIDIVGSIAEKVADKVFWESVEKIKSSAIKKLGIKANVYVEIVKGVLKLFT